MDLNLSLLGVKALAVVAISAVGLIGGIIPILATRHSASHRFLSLSNALAGGIFLGVGFLHLLPESGEALEEAIDYPLAPLLAAVGVCTLLLIDRVVCEVVRPFPSVETGSIHRPMYPFVLLAVLSIHSVVAGIALGLEADIADSVLVMLAIVFHKGSAAFALVVSVIASGADRKRLWTILGVFVAMTPLGIVLGTGVSSLFEQQQATLAGGVFHALAAGTFIYIAILDVIGAELSTIDDRIAHFTRSVLVGDDDVPLSVHDTDRLIKFVLVITGLASTALLALWV